MIFSSTALGFLSRTSEGVVFGRSFFAASAMLSLVALPLVVASTREGLNAIPQHVREASYAVGKTKIATTRRILLPAARPQVATGAMLGLGRIIGDTAIIVVLLGATQNFAPVEGSAFPLNYLRGAGTTLTNFVYEASPTGNLNQPQKAYAAAFVLLLMVLALNAAVDIVHRRAQKGRNVEFVTPASLTARSRRLEPAIRRRSGGCRSRIRPATQVAPATTNGDALRRPAASPRRDARSARRSSRSGAWRSTTSRSPTPIAKRSKAVSLPVRQGEVLAMIGPSGCGKTTLLRSLNRLTELTRTATLQRPHPARRRRHHPDRADLAAAPGDDGLPAAQPVPDERLRQHRLRAARAGLAAPAQEGRWSRKVHSALDRAGLFEEVKDNLDHPALKLSGGQQQRLCIARALAAEPEVLLLDEPCSALDPQSTQVIEDLIVKLRDDVAVVIVTHNLQQAYRIADHVAFMYLGDLVEYSSATALFDSPREQRTKEYVSGAFG